MQERGRPERVPAALSEKLERYFRKARVKLSFKWGGRRRPHSFDVSKRIKCTLPRRHPLCSA
jgi:hypothetical protein